MTDASTLYSLTQRAYLQFRPYDGAIVWDGGIAGEHAHVFSYVDAANLLLDLPEELRVVLKPEHDRPARAMPDNAQRPKGKAA